MDNEKQKNELAEYLHELIKKYPKIECEDAGEFLQRRVERIYDIARHRPCPKERQSAISFLHLAARRFSEMARTVDRDIAVMYAKSLEAIQREVEVC
ncbi:MAG: hypothetical protein IJU76_08165 [Desulfovibrionaceae bacterium]|nr:hypothetical protein [Desulfovibrionaceae bacterium]